MISRVIFLGDPYRGDQAGNIKRLEGLFSPALQQIGVPFTTHISAINTILDPDEWLNEWKSSLESDSSCALETIDFSKAAVIGFEIPEKELRYLEKEEIPWVNVSIHPVRFLDDLYLEVSSSFSYDMEQHAASEGLISFCVNSLRINHAPTTAQNHPSTLAIFGQTPIDKSVYFDGQFHRLDSYLTQLDELAQSHDEIIFKPHPHLTDPNVDQLILERYHATQIETENVYELLANGSINTACAISSSIISEAPYFGITGIFLEPKARRFGSPISYRTLLDDRCFWEEGLLQRQANDCKNHISRAVPANYLRQVFSSWGYVTEEQSIEKRLQTKQAELMNDIAQKNQEKIEQLVAECKTSTNQTQLILTQSEARALQAEVKTQELEATLQQLETRALQAENHSLQNESKVSAAEAATRDALKIANDREADLAAARQELHDVHQANHHHWQLAEARQQQIDAFLTSTSWRITAPLRQLSSLASFGLAIVKTPIKVVLKFLVKKGIEIVSDHPKLRGWLVSIIAKFPGLSRRIKALAPPSQQIFMRKENTLVLDQQRELGNPPDIDAILERIKIELTKKQP